MTVRDIKERLNLTVCSGGDLLDREVSGGYSGDLLSDVMAHSKAGDVWVTIQVHVNIVAVAVLNDLAAIIIANGRAPAAETVSKAGEEKVPILVAALSAYAVSGQLYTLGVGSVT